jgi:hypothetical protein
LVDKDKENLMITLGQKVRDIVTGFTGIAIARVEYLNGCVQFCVKPPVDKDGKMESGEYIDDSQLELVDGEIQSTLLTKNSDGGPSSDSPPDRYTA